MDLRLPAAAGELTRAEQKILDYINTNTDAFLFSSIGQLAQRLELSDATVSRFARHVGCRDFKALKSLVLEQSPGPAVKLAATLSQGARFSPQAWLERQRAYLETTIQQLSTGEFDRAVEALCSAQRVFIHGKNASASLAQLLHFRLRRLGIEVALLPSGGSREGRVLLEHSRATGYRTLAFVGRTCLPAEERADVSLFAYRGTEKEYHSMAAPAALLDALAVAAAERLGAESAERLQSLHQMKKDYFPDG